MFFSIVINSIKFNLLSFVRNDKIKSLTAFFSFNEHSGGTAEIYISEDKRYLLKFMRCKYRMKDGVLFWFYKNPLKKISVFKLDAYRETRGYKIAKKAGIKTPKVYAWGVPCSIFNDFLSYIVMEYKSDSLPGSLYFEELSFDDKKEFIVYIVNQLVQLSRLGYSHRDFHLDNLLIDSNGEIYWIDNHFKRLPFFSFMKVKQLDYSIRHIVDLVKKIGLEVSDKKYSDELIYCLTYKKDFYMLDK